MELQHEVHMLQVVAYFIFLNCHLTRDSSNEKARDNYENV